ncbi:hypothetical protein N0V90_008948 [Kalmusia sp. IMI 367209]|nr:hypothetical protein N0V90_008948 [Kalmusia sp. IMI 367209]
MAIMKTASNYYAVPGSSIHQTSYHETYSLDFNLPTLRDKSRDEPPSPPPQPPPSPVGWNRLAADRDFGSLDSLGLAIVLQFCY